MSLSWDCNFDATVLMVKLDRDKAVHGRFRIKPGLSCYWKDEMLAQMYALY